MIPIKEFDALTATRIDNTYARRLELRSHMPVVRLPLTEGVSPQTFPSTISLKERLGWSVRYGWRGRVDPRRMSAGGVKELFASERTDLTYEFNHTTRKV
jgi:hypothetical protein